MHVDSSASSECDTCPLPSEVGTLLAGNAGLEQAIKAWPAKFVEALRAWLLLRENEATRRLYWTGLRRFIIFLSSKKTKSSPLDVTVPDVADFLKHLRDEKLEPSTLRSYLAGCRSFFSFLLRPQTAREAHGLILSSPFSETKGPKVKPFERMKEMREDVFNKLVATCEEDRHTVKGKRDMALLLTFLHTAVRRTEVAGLKVGDFYEEDETHWFDRKRKGGEVDSYEVPPPAWNALQASWATRTNLTAESPAFVATTNAGKNRRGLDGVPPFEERPICGHTIQQMIKLRGRRAGINPDDIRLHGIRHLVGRFMRRNGRDLEDIRKFLRHKSLATTQVYVQEMEKVRAKDWKDLQKLATL